MNVLLARFGYSGINPDIRVCEVRETKTRFIENEGDDVIKYKKVTGKEYVAVTDETWSKEYLYHLDSDFAITHLGDSIKQYDHHNKEYIERKLKEFVVIKDAKDKLSKLRDSMTHEQAVKFLNIFGDIK